MDLNMELVKAVREAQAATEKAATAFSETSQRYELTQDGKTREAARFYGAARTTAETAKVRGLEAIAAKCAELDTQEQAAAVKRATDTEYLNRLEMKLRIFGGLDAKAQADADLRIFFAEFENDPLAAAAISAALGDPMRAVNILPANNTGKRQEHLRGAVQAAFESAMNKAGAEVIDEHDLSTTAIFGRKSELDAFVQYCTAQNADFSLDDLSIWERIRGEQTAQGKDAASFNWQFKGVREH
jgi:hypothetical protein